MAKRNREIRMLCHSDDSDDDPAACVRDDQEVLFQGSGSDSERDSSKPPQGSGSDSKNESSKPPLSKKKHAKREEITRAGGKKNLRFL